MAIPQRKSKSTGLSKTKKSLQVDAKRRQLKKTSTIALTKENTASTFDDVRAIREGLPFSAFESVRDTLRLNEETICSSLKIPKRTLARRKSGSKLTSRESELVLRLEKVRSEAEAVLGSAEKAREWLTASNNALNGDAPIRLLDTGPGFNEVLDVLRRIEFGVYS